MIQDVSDVAHDTDEHVGWGLYMDVDQAPLIALPWLAQLVGVRLPPPLSSEDQATYTTRMRARVKATDGFNRGSVSAMRAAGQQHLTGRQVIYLRERDTSPYHLTVVTYTGETPDEAALLAALLEQKPGGLVLDLNVVPGQDYTLLRDNYTDYQDVKDTYSDYDAVRSDQP